MSFLRPVRRWITPHAFNFDGYRWHARCFCHQSKSFRDFLLSRIKDVPQKAKQIVLINRREIEDCLNQMKMT